ncbi:hypothetical protein K4F52_007480 [Lecanicillium sp. MT-2017a]|nr:hypothetical protein K4F52_007480 [Lecanicillium sp. MT-2017a]
MPDRIPSSRFYFEYKGHQIPDLDTFHKFTTSTRNGRPIIYLAGDSSLDNKFWVLNSANSTQPVATPSIYKTALEDSGVKLDVAFWLNHFLGSRATAINTAVEASLLRERKKQLLDHDAFIRDHIGIDDILIVSVGANDIAMRPNAATIFYMLLLAWLTPLSSIRNGSAWCLRYFVNMFMTDVEEYVAKLVENTKPRAVIACMIYYPLEAQAAKQKSWADIPLMALGYNSSPSRLQTAIAKMYELATAKIQVRGVEVIPLALYETLDGKNADDYIERVEPSVAGGRKMASRLVDIINPMLGDEAVE